MTTHEPDAVNKPVQSHGGAMTAHLGLILHVTTNHGDPYNFFSNPKNQASSTWWVSDNGALEEYVDPDLKAWAQAEGNATYDSVETSGTPDQPLTGAQIETLAHLYAWGHGHYGWPFTLAEKPGDKGLGWHGMGGQAWGGHVSCPGDKRKAQRPAILKRAQEIVGGSKAPAPKPAAKPVAYKYSHLPLRQGDHNPDVGHVQSRLGLKTVDNAFGPNTEKDVRLFQSKHSLGVDGVVGPDTAAALG